MAFRLLANRDCRSPQSLRAITWCNCPKQVIKRGSAAGEDLPNFGRSLDLACGWHWKAGEYQSLRHSKDQGPGGQEGENQGTHRMTGMKKSGNTGLNLGKPRDTRYTTLATGETVFLPQFILKSVQASGRVEGITK